MTTNANGCRPSPGSARTCMPSARPPDRCPRSVAGARCPGAWPAALAWEERWPDRTASRPSISPGSPSPVTSSTVSTPPSWRWSPAMCSRWRGGAGRPVGRRAGQGVPQGQPVRGPRRAGLGWLCALVRGCAGRGCAVAAQLQRAERRWGANQIGQTYTDAFMIEVLLDRGDLSAAQSLSLRRSLLAIDQRRPRVVADRPGQGAVAFAAGWAMRSPSWTGVPRAEPTESRTLVGGPGSTGRAVVLLGGGRDDPPRPIELVEDGSAVCAAVGHRPGVRGSHTAGPWAHGSAAGKSGVRRVAGSGRRFAGDWGPQSSSWRRPKRPSWSGTRPATAAPLQLRPSDALQVCLPDRRRMRWGEHLWTSAPGRALVSALICGARNPPLRKRTALTTTEHRIVEMSLDGASRSGDRAGPVHHHRNGPANPGRGPPTTGRHVRPAAPRAGRRHLSPGRPATPAT